MNHNSKPEYQRVQLGDSQFTVRFVHNDMGLFAEILDTSQPSGNGQQEVGSFVWSKPSGKIDCYKPFHKIEWVACSECGEDSEKDHVAEYCSACGEAWEPDQEGDSDGY